MENRGVRVNMPYLERQIEEVSEQIRAKERKLRRSPEYRLWHKHYGQKLKLGSRQQLADIIFDKLGHERKAVVAKKYRSDDGDSLKRESKYNQEAFAHIDLPFIKTYFACEKLKKLKGTYLEGIKREVVDGFVHPSYNLHSVVSYRSSCNGPNWQNVIARNPELAKIIRSCYIPRKGRHLVEIDYGQIEVRVAACYTKDPKLIRYIEDPTTDMHRDMAAKLYLMDREFLVREAAWAKKTVRDWAKNRFVFPEFYGSVYFQCAQALWKDVHETKMPDGKTVYKHLRSFGIKKLGDTEAGADVIDNTFVAQVREAEDYLWHDTFTVYTEWKNRWYENYLKRGWFDLYTGFRVEGLLKRNDVLNYSIQGSSFHCLLWSVVELVKYLKKKKMRTCLVGEIHDCMVLDVPPEELQEVLSVAKEIMIDRLRAQWPWIIVPLETESDVTPIDRPWSEKALWTNKNGTWIPKA